MIPFASQRGLGQDLAAHLQNEYDNERMEVAGLRGSVAQDLHGAFAEWEVQAKALTNCRNYLYSLSINPDPEQGELTREQYDDYIARVEDKLGLSDQPRAIVFHTKHGREHCHVVWSRIDTENERAVQLAFDREKLMMVTREFARDHGLSLPKGYDKDSSGKDKQLSLYEQHQQTSTGLTKEQRMEQVTDAWRASDSPQAFVQALAEQGYILATGKRPYVLIDIYGEMNALPKLIDDKNVRTKDIREFLGKEFTPENLPSVEDARELAAQHRKALEDHKAHEQKSEAIANLKKAQAQRRQKLNQYQADLRAKHQAENDRMKGWFRQQRDAQRSTYFTTKAQIKEDRSQQFASVLAAFLGRITLLDRARNAVYRYQDRRRLKAHIAERQRLARQQEEQQRELQKQQQLQAAELARQERALSQIDRKELFSLEQSLRAEQRIADRGSSGKMPAIRTGRETDQPKKTRARQRSAFAEELVKAASGARRSAPKIKEEFEKAARDEKSDGKGEGSKEGPKPVKRSRSNRKRRRDRDKDRGR